MRTLTEIPFWFLRHGQTDWNAKDLSQGNIDIPLNAVGIQQAHDAAARLVGRGIAAIVTSPLSRAHDTARIVSETINVPIVEIEEGLREVSFGVQEGQPMSEWFSDWVDGIFTPEKAESFPQLRARAVAAANRVLRLDGPVLIVAHGALFRALRAEMGLPANIRTPNAVPLFCQPAKPHWNLLEP